MAENQNNNNNSQNTGSNVVGTVASTLHQDARDVAGGMKDIIMALMEALQKLAESIGNLGGSRNGVLANQIKELSNNIKEAAEKGEIRGEVLDELCNLTTEVNGKLQSLTPDKVEEVEQFVTQKTAEIKNKYDNMTIDPKAHEGNFYDSVQKSSKDPKITEMSRDEFKAYFDANAKVFVDSETKQNKRYIKLGDEAFEVDFTIKENEGKKSADLSVKALEDDSALQAETVKEVDLQKSHPYTRVIVDLANENNMYSVAQARFEIAKEAEMLFKQSNALQIAQFFSQHRDKVQTYEEGRVEATFKKEDKSFYIRDRQSGEMLIFTPKANGDYEIIAAGTRGENTAGFRNTSDIQHIGGWTYLSRTGKTNLEIAIPDANIGALMASTAVKEFLAINGVNSQTLDSLLTSKSDRGSYAVSEKGMERVNQLKAAIEKHISDSPQTYGNVTAKNVTVKRGKGKSNATYLQLTDEKGGTMSFAFRSDGTPLSLSYKGKDDKTFKFMYNLATHRVTDDIWTLRGNESVMNLLNLCRQSAEDVAFDMSKGERSKGETIINEPTHNSPFTTIPQELQAKINGQDYTLLPNRAMIYSPFTKDNIVPPESITLSGIKGGAENAIFYALALETMGISDKAEECWKKAMETAVKNNHISIGNNPDVALEQYKLIVRETLSDPKDDFALAGRYADFLRSEDATAFAEQYAKTSGLPFTSGKKAIKAFENNLQDIAQEVEQGVAEMTSKGVLSENEYAAMSRTLPLIALTEGGSLVYTNDFSHRPLKFDEIAKVVTTVFNGAEMQDEGKGTLDSKQIVEELRKTIKKEGTIGKNGEVSFKKPEKCLATQDFISNLSEAMMGIYTDDAVKTFLDNREGMDGQFIAEPPKPVKEPVQEQPAPAETKEEQPVIENGQENEPPAIESGDEQNFEGEPLAEGMDEPETVEPSIEEGAYNPNGKTFHFGQNAAPAPTQTYVPPIVQWEGHSENTVSGIVTAAIKADNAMEFFKEKTAVIKSGIEQIDAAKQQMSPEEYQASGFAEKREQLVRMQATIDCSLEYIKLNASDFKEARKEYKENGSSIGLGDDLASNATAYSFEELSKHGYSESDTIIHDEPEQDAPAQEEPAIEENEGQEFDDDEPDYSIPEDEMKD